MGGLQLDFIKEITMGLLLNGFQRLIKLIESRHENRGFLYILAADRICEASMMDMRELCEVVGPKILQKVAHRLRNTFPYLTQVCTAMSIMLEMNEKSKEGWHTAHIAGHSDSHDLHRITATDGITLSHYGLRYVEQPYGKDYITGRIELDRDAVLPERLNRYNVLLVTKCKDLRIKFRSHAIPDGGAIGSFFQVTQNMRYSSLRPHTLHGEKMGYLYRHYINSWLDIEHFLN
jgi:hypothetical protein